MNTEEDSIYEKPASLGLLFQLGGQHAKSAAAVVRQAIKDANGELHAVPKILGVSRRTLARYVVKLELSDWAAELREAAGIPDKRNTGAVNDKKASPKKDAKRKTKRRKVAT